MPFELIVQAAFTERLEGGAVRVRQVGEHISQQAEIEALRGNPHVVQLWMEEPAPTSEHIAEPQLDVTVKNKFPKSFGAFPPAQDAL